MQPRLEYRPDGSFPWQAAVGAPLIFGLSLFVAGTFFHRAGLPLGVASAETFWVTIASPAVALAAAWKPLRLLLRWSVREASEVRTSTGEVVDSVAERQWRRRDPDSMTVRELEPGARYLFGFVSDDGEARICDVPRGLWATLRPGDRIRLVWRGWDILELEEISGEVPMEEGRSQ